MRGLAEQDLLLSDVRRALRDRRRDALAHPPQLAEHGLESRRRGGDRARGLLHARDQLTQADEHVGETAMQLVHLVRKSGGPLRRQPLAEIALADPLGRLAQGFELRAEHA